MSEQWYWNHGRQLLGPLDTETIEHLIRQHRVADRDQLRLTTDDAWLTGAEVKALFSGKNPASSPSEAAARLLSQANRLREDAADDGAASAAGPLALLHRLFRRVLRHVSVPTLGLADRLGEVFAFCVRRMAPLANRYVALVAALAVLAGVVAGSINTGSSARNRSAYDDLTQAWDALRELQTRRATKEDYSKLESATLPSLERHLTLLIQDGKDAAGRPPDSFSWMDSTERGWEVAHARKALIQAMFAMKSLLAETKAPGDTADQSSDPPQSAQILQQNMLVARQYLDGEQRLSMNSTSIQPAAGSSGHGLGPLVWGMLIVDGALVIYGVWFWRRRTS